MKFNILSKARLAANRANAQKSTGPVSDEGKAASSKNAFKHGLASANLYVPAALQPLYDEITQDLNDAILPEGTLEDDTFIQLRNARFQMERILILQAQLGRESAAHGLDPILDPEVHKQYDRLDRYHRAAQATFRNYMKEMRKLQSERLIQNVTSAAGMPVPPLSQPRPAFALGAHLSKLRQNQANKAIEDFINGPLPGGMN